jgi:ABC-type Fe3+ transport system permease subunit
MAKQHKSKKQATPQQAVQPASTKRQQGTMRKVFTVIICVVVALGLMLPITGLGVASCAASAPPVQNQQGE